MFRTPVQNRKSRVVGLVQVLRSECVNQSKSCLRAGRHRNRMMRNSARP